MRHEINQEGASYIEVYCTHPDCYSHAPKLLHKIHKGYASSGGLPITTEELEIATTIATKHEADTGHETRLIEGKL